ncbi:MarR family transcriptional regulator [Microbacterium protaetiae]|uniref:MarR family transcriptional regulator n=1 Tax=Microbacterium protaetiae TaxID=2509458 RepID=A0A4P6ECF9_9MICO|nr:MarR family transcriptional regulator [Microbacterium protaetiae]QAY59734.1 MarR family transcriptional regulator [Microbacterium protaetiae]
MASLPGEESSASALAEQLRQAVSYFVRRTRARSDELTRSRAEALAQLDRAGAQTITQLATHLAVLHQAMSRTVLELEHSGLVARQASPADSRASVIRITDAGAQALARDRETRRDLIGDMIAACLDDQERALLERVPGLLKKLTP